MKKKEITHKKDFQIVQYLWQSVFQSQYLQKNEVINDQFRKLFNEIVSQL